MKISQLALPIFLFGLLLFFLTSCTGIIPISPAPSPGTTEEDATTISGQIKMPLVCCVPVEKGRETEKSDDETEFWSVIPGAIVELKSSNNCKKVLDTTESDESGNYTFKDVKPGLYIITAYCPSDNNYLVKDVAEKIAGQALDAGIPDCASTSTALVAEYHNGCYNGWYFCFNKYSAIYKRVKTIAEAIDQVDLVVIENNKTYDELVALVCDSLQNCCGSSPGTTPSNGGGTTPATETTISVADISGIKAPVTGETPVTSLTSDVSMSAISRASKATEQYTGTVSWNPNHSKFEANVVYTATITLIPKEGFTFKGVPENFFKVTGADKVSNLPNSGVVTAVFPKTEPLEHTVTFKETNKCKDVSIQVYNDEECQEANKVGDPITTNNNGEASKDLPDGNYWFIAKFVGYNDYKKDFKVEGIDKTVEFTMVETEYTVSFKEKNELTGVSIQLYSDADRTVPVGSVLTTNSSGIATANLSNGSYWFTASLTDYDDYNDNFEVWGAAKNVEFTMVETVNTVNIAAIPGVTPPVAGATPVTAITETAQYTGTVDWSPNNSPFEYDTPYTATITLIAKSGFTLTGVAKDFFTVDGADPVSNDANSGVVTAVFPKTAIEKFTVTFPDPDNGSLSAKVDDAAINSGDEIEKGKSVVFTASPDSSYQVKGWKLNNNPVDSTELTYTVNSLSSDIEVEVEFEEIPPATYEITFKETNELAGVSIQLYSDADRTQPLGGPGITNQDGEAIRMLANGNYWFTASLAGSEDCEDSFEVDGEGKTIEFTMVSAPQPDGLVLWLDAEDYDPDTGNWTDLSSFNNDVSQTSSSNRPNLISSGLNGNPVVRFDGTYDYLSLNWSDSLGGSLNTDSITIFMVLKNNDMSGGSQTIIGRFNQAGHISFRKSGSEDVVYAIAGVYDNRVYYQEPNGVGDAGPYVLGFQYDHSVTTHRAFVNGIQTDVKTNTAVDINWPATSIGRDHTASSTEWSGDIAEIRIYNYALDDGERAAVEAELQSKWLPIPDKYTVTFTNPANGSLTAKVDGSAISSGTGVEEGKDIIFTVVPTGSYVVDKWTVNGSTVSGATSLTYTHQDLSGDIEVAVVLEEAPQPDGLVLWLDAEDYDPDTGNWTDLSSFNNDVSQTSSSNRPAYISDGLNGNPVVHFNGEDDYLDLIWSDSLGGSLTTDSITIFMVLKNNNMSDSQTLMGNYNELGDVCFHVSYNQNALTATVSSRDNRIDISNSTQPYVATYKVTPTSHTTYVNGVESESDSLTENIDWGTTTIGKNGGTLSSNIQDWFWEGDIAEIRIYNYALDDTDRAAVESELQAKWLTGGGPGTLSDAIVIYSDPQNSSNHPATVAHVLTINPHTVLISGDLVMNASSTTEWNTFNNLVDDYNLLYTARGNHDGSTNWDGRYDNYYSDDINLGGYTVHLIVLDTNDSGSGGMVLTGDIGDTQKTWFEADLQENSSADFTIVSFHHPVYSSGSHRGSSYLQTKLVPLFEQYGVDMVFYGHDHTYEVNTVNDIHYVQTCGGSPRDGSDPNYCLLTVMGNELTGQIYDIYGNMIGSSFSSEASSLLTGTIYQQVSSFTDGKNYIIAAKDGTDYYAVKFNTPAEYNYHVLSESIEVIDGVAYGLEGTNIIVDPDNSDLVWAAEASSSRYLLRHDSCYLYGGKVDPQTGKASSSGTIDFYNLTSPRICNIDLTKFYAYSSSSGNYYLTFDGSDFSASTTEGDAAEVYIFEETEIE